MTEKSTESLTEADRIASISGRLRQQLNKLSTYFAIAVSIIATLVLIGWQFNIDWLKHPLPASKAMNPAAAVTFIFASAAFLYSNASSNLHRIIPFLLSALVLLTGTTKLLSFLFDWDFHIDTLLFPGKLGDDRIVPIAAINFTLIGTALLLSQRKRKLQQTTAIIIALTLICISFFSILGYLFEVRQFYGIFTYLPMAIHAAICFLLLALSILFSNPDGWLMKDFTSNLAGSTVARRLIPAAILVPVLLGYLRMLGHKSGIFTTEFGVTILVMGIIVAFMLIIWYQVTLLNKGDFQRKTAESILRQREEALQAARQEIRDFVDSMSTLCAKLTPTGQIMMVNKIALQASGLAYDELLNTNFLDGAWWTYDQNVHARVLDAFTKARHGTPVNYDENIFVFGQILTINFSLTPILKDGNVDYIVAEGRDITALKRTEAALEEQTHQLQVVNNELEAFTYSVSHDLRAPIRGIIGFTEILEQDHAGKLDEEAKRITGIIKRNGIKMGRLIDDLLDFSRTARKDLVKTAVHMNELVNEVIRDISVGDTNKIEWTIHPLPVTQADLNTLRQAWINLISNAIKYSANEPQPRIEVGSYKEGNEDVFFIRDNGIGFNQQYHDKLFKVFHRLHNADEFEGTGVGLALVEKIISKHGGKIWAEGTLGKGATFYFTLGNGYQ